MNRFNHQVSRQLLFHQESQNTTNPTFFDDQKKTKKLLVRRKGPDSEKSYDSSRRSFKAARLSDLDSQLKPSYIKQNMIPNIISSQDSNVPKLRLTRDQQKIIIKQNLYPAATTSTILYNNNQGQYNSKRLILHSKNSNNMYGQTSLSLHNKQQSRTYRDQNGKSNINNHMSNINAIKKIQALQESICQLNQQNHILLAQNLRLKNECQTFETKYTNLQSSNKTLQIQYDKLKCEFNTMSIQRKKIQCEKKSLGKKIQFLQKVTLNSDTRNLQSLRQQHLQKQLNLLKSKLDVNKSHLQNLLQQQMKIKIQQIYTAQKTIALQKTNILCMQKKLNQIKLKQIQIGQNQRLKARIKVLNNELKNIKKQLQKVQKQNKQLILKHKDDFSFDLQ